MHTHTCAGMYANVHSIGCFTMGLPESDRFDLSHNLPDDEFKHIISQTGEEFITVSCGTEWVFQTKSWPFYRWQKVVDYIENQINVPVIHLDSKDVPDLKCKFPFSGMTNIRELSYLLLRSQLHMGPECGTVRLAHLLGTHTVVIFGPTFPDFYGLPNQTKIISKTCSPCVWKYGNWRESCYHTENKDSLCMNTIGVEEVCESVEKAVKMVRLVNDHSK